MTRSTKALLFLLPALLVGCETGGDMPEMEAADGPAGAPSVDPATIEAEVGEVRDTWISSALAGDAATVASLYTDDAVFVGGDGEVMNGPAAIEAALAEDFPTMSALDVTSSHMVTGADVVSDMGTFRQTFTTPDGQEQTVTGRYLVVLRKQADGSWKIVQHLSAADVPAMGDM